MITIQRLPLFRLPAMSSAVAEATVAVFAQFVSFLLQSLNWEVMINGKGRFKGNSKG